MMTSADEDLFGHLLSKITKELLETGNRLLQLDPAEFPELIPPKEDKGPKTRKDFGMRARIVPHTLRGRSPAASVGRYNS
jgi:hypothetical protein